MALAYRSFEWVQMYCSTCGVHTDVTPSEFHAANGVLHCEDCHFQLKELRYEPELLDEDYEVEDRWARMNYDYSRD